ncbi:ATP-binding protein [Mycobacterium branderi]|uniref:histidine kinase n=2 Tax=Mycobacterium branderi TaxID=43348 RepID=A0AA91RJW6_9MYCO|nr:ATP-binding protein [Mycobacterium branderi]MCV7233170.1 HAMP domain-containing protein [Mycobacterium branderi]ORA41254.1 ATP-binding protein [Mycobacterium branderi]
MTLFARPTRAVSPAIDETPETTAPVKRPPTWSLRNWPVRWKVVAIVAVPLILAMVFGGLRIYGALNEASELRLAADRAEVVPAITKYMSALDVALLSASNGGDAEGAKKNYEARKFELQSRLADTDVAADVRNGVGVLLNGGQALLDKVASNSIGLRDRVTGYAPILLTAENAIDGSVRVDNEKIRAAAQGLSRAIGARGQMMMQQLLVTRGGDLPEPELRTSMMTLAGTEPSTLFGMAEVLGVGSPEAKKLQQQMVTRMAVMSDPASLLVNNPALLRSIQTTDAIAAQIIKDTTSSVTKAVEDRANDRRDAAIRDTVLVLAAIVAALVIVLLVARSLIQPLRVLRDGALKVAHEDLEREIARVRAGDERAPEPLPVYTSEEIGQVAHAVDELHTQALLLAGDEARLRLLVNDMFETMSRRNRSLVDQQLSLIDRLERNEQDPERLDSLFRLDHLAARMRRIGANLLVLAGAQTSRGDQRAPQSLSTLINAATSEVEDYRRVETPTVPDSTVLGTAAGDIVHLLAELIDNALRYSPPMSPVRVSATRRNDGGVLIQVVDAGLGMTDGDRRIANMRLRAGGEVTPDNARHMGLFVVGRLADRHGIRVRLRNSSRDGHRPGTTAEVYLPPAVLVGADYVGPRPAPAQGRMATVEEAVAAADYDDSAEFAAPPEPAERNGSHPPEAPASLLPRRTPGSSGITGAPARPAEPPEQQWWGEQEQPTEAPAAQPVSNTSSFFSRPRVEASEPQEADEYWPTEAAAPVSQPAEPEDLIYQRMLSEWLVDPHELAHSADLDWQTVWDRGWSAAAEAESLPVSTHTDTGLPVREPGARLVPGGAMPEPAGDRVNGAAHHRADEGNGVASNGGFGAGRHQAPDPEAIRASISSHFGGVRAGRSHARESNQGPDHE